LAINCQDIAGTAAIYISPFKTDVPKQPKPPFTLAVLLVAITREEDVFNLLAFNRRAADRRKNDTVSAPELFFFMNMAPAPEIMVFVCVAPAPEQWRF